MNLETGEMVIGIGGETLSGAVLVRVSPVQIVVEVQAPDLTPRLVMLVLAQEQEQQRAWQASWKKTTRVR